MAKRYESTQTKQTLNRVQEERMPFDWSINPYRGCAHGCSFCYARAFQSFLGLGAEDEFQNRILIKENAAEALEAQLAKLAIKYGGRPEAAGARIGKVAIGTATDPYQPVEAKAKITRACLEVLAKYQVPTTITTRSPLILRDMDVMSRMRSVSVNISLNTLDPSIVRNLEPETPAPAQRLETLHALAEGGIHAGVFIAPVLPGLTDSEDALGTLIREAKTHDAKFAMVSVLRLSPDVKSWYYQALQRSYPQLLPDYLKRYSGSRAKKSYVNEVHERAERLLRTYGLQGETSSRHLTQTGSVVEREPVEQLVLF